MRKRQAAQRRRQHHGESSREDVDGSGGSGGSGAGGTGGGGGGGSGSGGGEYDEEMAMDELWKQYQRQRPEDPATLVVHGAVSSNDNNASAHGATGTTGTTSSDPDPSGTRIDREDMVAEKLWEYVVGWCLIGCIFVGAGLILCANFMVHDYPANTTPWTFEVDEEASLMDTVVANIMKAALGMQDFEDQLMEHGIFVFIVGINGFVLVRQRVFGRRREYEQELMRGGMMLPMGMGVNDVGGYDLEGKAVVVGGKGQESEEDDERFREGKRDFYENLHLHQVVAQGVERFTTTDQIIVAQTSISATNTEIGAGVGGGGPIENTSGPSTCSSNDPRSGTSTSTPTVTGGPTLKETSIHHTKEPPTDEKKTTGGTGSAHDDDNAPDFATMSFLAWFNYLQVGILIIEFLQLFSFPLRELMEFYNQAEKTGAMFEGAKTILDVFRTTATANTGDGTMSSSSAADGSGGIGSGIYYKDGILSIGNNTLFDFNPRNSSTQDKKSPERPTFALEISEDNATLAGGSLSTTVLDQNDEDMELLRKNTSLQTKNATEGGLAHKIGGGVQKMGASVDWIKENLHSWLPNITALMDNNTVDGLESGRFEELRDNLLNAAVGVALQGFGGTNSSSSSSTGPNNGTTLPAGGDSRATKSPTDKMNGRNSNCGGDGDIVMQVVNSLGLQPSINTHDWYLLRFWSCFAAVVLGWMFALSIHAWNRRCRRLRREGRPHWNALSVGWVSCFIPVVVTSLFVVFCDS